MPEIPSVDDLLVAFELFREAILCAAIAGAVLGYLGVHVVLRRMVFATATLTQAAGVGVALGFYAQIHLATALPPWLGGIGVALAVAGLLTWEPPRMSREALLAVLWIGCGAAAVLLGDRITQEAHDIASILFGTAVLVRPEDLVMVTVIGLPALGIAAWWQPALLFAGFDREAARVHHLPVRALELTLWALITLVVAAATRALGALPVFAFSVLPGVAALLATRRASAALPLAAVFGMLAGVLGYMAAFFLSFPVGASQAATAALLVPLGGLLGLLRRE